MATTPERAWPFENVPEGGRRKARTPEDFIAGRTGVDAMVIRIGLNDAQLVLVDPDGAWDRWVYHSEDEATAVAESLDVEVHSGEYPEAVRVRMNARRRPPAEFDKGAYPEQGRVGPAISYPENRPRRDDVLAPPAQKTDR
ncbi:MAG: hypothetical protein M3277_11285 [Actinomycetota bacterium]|nr:hypothetical protein [Actinomycetota bacterium]